MKVKLKLEDGEVVLGSTGANYQSLRNPGLIALTNQRLVWKAAWSLRFLAYLLKKTEVIIPIAGIVACWQRGTWIIIETPRGDFHFRIVHTYPTFLSSVSYSAPKARQWAAKINELVLRDQEQARSGGCGS